MFVWTASWVAPGLLLGALNVAAVALLAVVAGAWARHEHRWRLALSAVATVAVILVAFTLTVRPSDIPVEWITILHHGLGRKLIMHLYGRGAHTGANFPFVLELLTGGPGLSLREVVWLNLLLGLINAAIFLHVALHLTRPVWAVLWTLVFALNPATFFASFSELPTNLLGLYALAGIIGWAVVIDAPPHPRWIRAAAYALCAVLTALAALTRAEVAAIGLVALALHALHGLAGAARWDAAVRWLGAVGERCLAWFGAHLGVVVLLCLVGLLLSISGIPHVIGRQHVAGVYPFNASFLGLFLYLPMLLLPIGVSIAVAFGFAFTTVRFVRYGGIALSLFVLVRTYFSAQYEYFEMGRYISYILPNILLLGLFGHEELFRLARRWPPNWARAATVGYVMAWCTLPLPGLVELYARPDVTFEGGFAQIFLDRDTQREARFLVELTERNPECVFVGRSIIDLGDPKDNTQYYYIVFGAPLREPIVVPERDAALADVIARYAPAASCVRLYYGHDCNLTFGDRCTAFIAGHRLIDERRFWALPYNNPRQSGYAAPEIVFATYAWP
jgi:hypothetical protein